MALALLTLHYEAKSIIMPVTAPNNSGKRVPSFHGKTTRYELVEILFPAVLNP
jgi:hypothetical protein